MNSEMTLFDDVQRGPTILIGKLTNQWTMRLTSKLQSTFQDSPNIFRILDDRAKVQPDRIIHRDQAYSSPSQDYAIIARYRDTTTSEMKIIGAGIGPNGTLAAEVLVYGGYLSRLSRSILLGTWDHANVEAAIATQGINGKFGPPQILVAEFW